MLPDDKELEREIRKMFPYIDMGYRMLGREKMEQIAAETYDKAFNELYSRRLRINNK